jgi:hypothetical protein
MRPSLDNIDMTKILPNYEPPKLQLSKKRSSADEPSYRDAGTITEDIRTRRPRFDVRIAMRPLRNDNPQQRLFLRHAQLETNRPAGNLHQQPSTSTQETGVATGTQTEGEAVANLVNYSVTTIIILHF